MSTLQIIAVAITIGLNGLDGFDVLSISFAGPGILAEYGLNKAQLGFVLSMELIGMSAGSLLLGPLADKIGRRPLMLGCLVLMAAGMFMVTTVNSIVVLCAWRIITGLGIGGLLAAINAVAAEFANHKSRALCVSIMAIGYPIGAVLGGMVVADLLKDHNWRSVFYFGAACTAAFIPLVLAFIPESIYWLTRKQPEGALEKINRILKRMGHAAVSSLPAISHEVRKRSAADLFAPGLIATTLLTAAAYFFHITTFYFVLKWTPNIVNSLGFDPSSSAQVLVWANVGGALGGAVLGLLTLRFSVKALTIAAMVASTVMVAVYGRSPADLQMLAMLCACAGFFTNGAIVGMYAIFAQAFPTHVRAGGTGFGIGVGRGGSVLAPIIAGFLFNAGQPVPSVALFMAFGSLLAAVVLGFLKLRPDDTQTETEGEGGTAESLRGASATTT
ncbi:MAG TPA: MFS transporter [Steroidobacteraceae bacterium]|jgi:benzoate transport|nr:MFS transporter [Steroidobacteraceae bacterium]